MPLAAPFPLIHQIPISDTAISDPVSPSQEEIEEALDILFPNSRPLSGNKTATTLMGKQKWVNHYPAFQKVTWPTPNKANAFENLPPMGQLPSSSESVYSTTS